LHLRLTLLKHYTFLPAPLELLALNLVQGSTLIGEFIHTFEFSALFPLHRILLRTNTIAANKWLHQIELEDRIELLSGQDGPKG